MLELGGSYAGAYLLRRGLFMPWELGQVLDPDSSPRACAASRRCATSPPRCGRGRARAHGKIAALETSLYMRNQLLRDTDWAGMAHGLEIRAPLVDAVLLRRSPPRGLREVLAREPRRRASRSALAAAAGRVPRRAKTGFVTPIGHWLQDRGLSATAEAAEITASRPKLGAPRMAAAWAERIGRHQMRLLALVTTPSAGPAGSRATTATC